MAEAARSVSPLARNCRGDRGIDCAPHSVIRYDRWEFPLAPREIYRAEEMNALSTSRAILE
jgi:hypothetical protein